MTLLHEFERQTEALIEGGTADALSLTPAALREALAPLRDLATGGEPRGAFPLVIVLTQARPEALMPLVTVKQQAGVVDMNPVASDSFLPQVELPSGFAYLMLDVEVGREYLNVPPSQALPQILAAGRSPLTVEEGVALLSAFPQVLADKVQFCAYSLAGSRRGDQRVPAIWMSYKRPRLGWCFDNAPHTWMGTASCALRAGVG